MKNIKKIYLVPAALIVIVIAWWLISPLWRTQIASESLPSEIPVESNSFGIMNPDQQQTFEEAMTEAATRIIPMAEKMPVDKSGIRATAELMPYAHEVKGLALVVEAGDKKFLRFEDLETINGPDLRIYLATDTAATDFVDLGPVRATRGSVNYEIPTGTDLQKYHIAMIWCRAFGVLFSYAEF